MPKVNLLGYTKPQLEALMTSLGQKPYKGRQMFNWLYKVRQHDFQLMTDLSKEVRARLDEHYTFRLMQPELESVSEDGTRKFLFRLEDGHPIETVFIPDDGRATVCISVQAGCALACRFCATGTLGLLRDLTPGEIVGQLMFLRERFGGEAFTNIVMMGMGEPLNNFAAVVDAIRIMTDPSGLCHAARRITISTSGVSPKIRKLADLGLKTRLAVSLHAAIQEKRVQLMPVAETFKLDKLMEAVRYYALAARDRVTFEYILFKGFNDTPEDVKALTRLVHGIPCKINLLAYNPVPGLPFARPTDEEVDAFARLLYPRVPAVTVRKSRGRDIDAACGQLAARAAARRTDHA
ncbi:MAG TPA: 23S rRNA (adenine(2503)-C(2))-methyltransferase RlmN [candidate division Zixibacteria bacterium]|nr:23S rRNA (adenine(2503)-C(2))-methyltransferase RlmN [candidate division Zixibacteria bacterium]